MKCVFLEVNELQVNDNLSTATSNSILLLEAKPQKFKGFIN